MLPFLKYSSNVCEEPVPWEFSTRESLLENIGEYKAISSAASLYTFSDSRSGPAALFVFSPRSNLATP